MAPWNFQCGILTLEFRALSPKPATANLNPKKHKHNSKKKKETELRSVRAHHNKR